MATKQDFSRCPLCFRPTTIDSYYTDPSKPSGRQWQCKECVKSCHRKRWADKHTPIVEPTRLRSKPCKACYGLSHRVQGAVCKCCGLEAKAS